MPAMHASMKTALTSAPYRFLSRRVVLPWALQGFRPTGEALEIGSGSGAMAAQLLATSPGLRLVATDGDPDMVTVARQTLAPFGERATAQYADAANLPFDDDRFDVVVSFAMLHHVVDWEAAVSEAVRVLRPGGTLVGYDLLSGVILHRGGDDHMRRMIRPGQLEAYLPGLPVTGVRTRQARGKLAVRFTAAKAA